MGTRIDSDGIHCWQSDEKLSWDDDWKTWWVSEIWDQQKQKYIKIERQGGE